GVALRPTRVVAERLYDHAHLPARVGDRLARVAGLDPREVAQLLLDVVCQATEHRRAVSRRDRAPRRERLLRTRDRGVGLLDARLRHLRHHLRGGRLQDPDHPCASRGGVASRRGGAGAARRERASSASAPTTRLRSSSSGCHSTPTAKLLSGSSIASTRPSSANPVATTPSPSSSTP